MATGFARLIALAATGAAAGLVHAQSVYYVDANATGAGLGTSWLGAFTSLQEAVDALEPGDTLYSRGTFSEVAEVWTEDVTWIGDSDPERPTWIRGDRYSDAWAWTGTGGVYALDGVAELINTDLRPGSLVYNYRRDDLTGSVTGINLSRVMDELPANGAGVYYGHVPMADDLVELFTTPNRWWWDEDEDRVYYHHAAADNGAFDPDLAGVCINGQNGVSVWRGGVRISGVNTIATSGTRLNNGYGMKGLGTFSGSVFENADIIDSGWHAAGFEIGSPSSCTLRNLRAWSSAVDGSNANNPFVFYANTDLDDAGHLGEDLVFHAYPLLGTDGAPIYSRFVPALGYSHSTGSSLLDLGGITWRRCHQYEYEADIEARHGPVVYEGFGIGAADLPPYTSDAPSTYAVVVEDCTFEGSSGKPWPGILYERCVFKPGALPFAGDYRTSTRRAYYLRSCTVEIGQRGAGALSSFINLESQGRAYLDACTFHAEGDTPMPNLFRLGNGSVIARQCVFSTEGRARCAATTAISIDRSRCHAPRAAPPSTESSASGRSSYSTPSSRASRRPR